MMQFFEQKIEETEFQINEKTQNLRRLEAQRNALNAKGWYCSKMCSTKKEIIMLFYCSPVVERRTAVFARARFVCRRSCQSDGKIESAG
jgi:hypothetical protein